MPIGREICLTVRILAVAQYWIVPLILSNIFLIRPGVIPRQTSFRFAFVVFKGAGSVHYYLRYDSGDRLSSIWLALRDNVHTKPIGVSDSPRYQQPELRRLSYVFSDAGQNWREVRRGRMDSEWCESGSWPKSWTNYLRVRRGAGLSCGPLCWRGGGNVIRCRRWRMIMQSNVLLFALSQIVMA